MLSGGGGKDTLTGAGNQDQFVFDQTPGAANADRITDFDVTLDSIHLDARVMPALGASGNFLSGDMRFYAAAGATGGHDADDRVVFDTATGNLYYDADGNGAGAGQLVVTLQPGAALGDFSIVVDNGTAGAFIQGTSGNDNLLGTLGHDTIDGLGGNDTINGSEGDDRIDGGTGNDSLTAAEGFDLIVGGDGNDTLDGAVIGFLTAGEAAVDTMDGGLGDDVYFVDNQSDVLSDAGGIDTVQVYDMSWILAAGFENLTIRNDFSESGFTGIGNDLDNVMSVTFASVRLDGRGGNDTLRGSGNQHGDLLLGGDGNDSLVAASGDDGLDGGAGDDTLMGGGDLDTLTGGTGADSFIFDVRPGVSGLDADVVTDFTSGIDRIRLDARVMPELGASGTLTADDPRFFAAPGAAAGHDADDRLVYDTSSGQLYFDPDGSGAETAGLIATLAGPLAATDITIDNGTAPGGQVIQGTSGNDSLTGTPGNDTMNGGLGDDTYIVTAGDVLTDAGGVDTVLSPVAWTLADSFENLTATGTAEVNLTGNNAANVLTGNAVHNFFNPRGGNDTIQGGGGDDWVRLGGGGVPSYGTKVIDLGAGLDSLDFGGFARSAIVVDLAAGTLSGGGEAGAGSATLISIEQVIGDGFNDQLSGSAAAETLNGGAGNDTLSGMGGNDTLIGGTGQDTFLFAAAPGAGNADLVSDFVSGTDKLSFDNSVFTALGADGNFVAGDARFAAGAGFTSGGDASDRIVYDTSSGNLYYDADGSGAGAALLVATLQGHPAIAATDITVI